MTTEQRSSRGRELAEQALIALATELGPHLEELVIIGGLNPAFLTEDPPVAHQGTNDVDILLSVGFVYDRDESDFVWLEEALVSAGFQIDPDDSTGWRWRLDVQGARVKVELLCDVDGEHPHVLDLPGCDRAAAMNLPGPGAALVGTVTRTLPIPDAMGSGTVELRFAGLGGYLTAKAAAIVGRRLAKDYYDFAYVLLYNSEGGPAQAAVELKREQDQRLSRYWPDLQAAVGTYVSEERPGAHVFAAEMWSSGSTTDMDTLLEDATSAAHEFWEELNRQDVPPTGSFSSGGDATPMR